MCYTRHLIMCEPFFTKYQPPYEYYEYKLHEKKPNENMLANEQKNIWFTELFAFSLSV